MLSASRACISTLAVLLQLGVHCHCFSRCFLCLPSAVRGQPHGQAPPCELCCPISSVFVPSQLAAGRTPPGETTWCFTASSPWTSASHLVCQASWQIKGCVACILLNGPVRPGPCGQRPCVRCLCCALGLSTWTEHGGASSQGYGGPSVALPLVHLLPRVLAYQGVLGQVDVGPGCPQPGWAPCRPQD